MICYQLTAPQYQAHISASKVEQIKNILANAPEEMRERLTLHARLIWRLRK